MWNAMTGQYKSEALAAAHETALGLTEAGVMAKRTMKVFDEMCLTPVEDMAPERIREIRLRENASQVVFARYLNVTTGLERDDGSGESVGARRDAAARCVVEAADAGREERPGRGRVTVPAVAAPRHPERGAARFERHRKVRQ